MRSSFMVVPDEEVVLILVRENMSFIEYLNLMMDIFREPEYDLSFNLLFDCRRATSFLTGEDLVEYWNMMEFATGQMGKMAVWMNADESFWSCELELFLNDVRSPFEYDVFYDAQSAFKYLGISDELYLEYPVINHELLNSAEPGRRCIVQENENVMNYDAQRKLLSGIYMERMDIKRDDETIDKFKSGGSAETGIFV